MNMKLTSAILLLTSVTCFAQQPATLDPANTVPKEIEPAVAIISTVYSKIDTKKPVVKTPADKAWVFRAPGSPLGSLEVGFQGSEVVYMVFRQGVGGTKWTEPQLRVMASHYEALKLISRNNYIASLAPSINGAIIYRKGFNQAVLLTGH